MKSLNFFLNNKAVKQNAAIFISGSGTNAEKVLEYYFNQSERNWTPAVIITDAPKKSRAKEIAHKFDIPLISHDIKDYYKKNGLRKVSLKTEVGRDIRQNWTNELRDLISTYSIDFGILAGFIPLTNITADFPCLNIHPGDLTVEIDGKRLLIGLHTIPIELAILNGHSHLRSSVILAQTYTGSGDGMDSGPILGISNLVPINLLDMTVDELNKISIVRPSTRPYGGYKDKLEKVAKYNLETLKQQGDWIVFPRVVSDFASNKFAFDNNSNLFYKGNNGWIRINTVVYGINIIKSI